jgi:hypothetical protein
MLGVMNHRGKDNSAPHFGCASPGSVVRQARLPSGTLPHPDLLIAHQKSVLTSRASLFRVLMLLAIAAPVSLFSQTDEIQVYDAEIARKGVFNVMIHTNFTPIGHKTAAFPGGIIPNRSVNGAAEWAYGVADWFEQGLYLPVYSLYSKDQGATINGFKVRELFVRPHAERRKFFYGVNFEFSVNARYWDPRRASSEIRPIVGARLGRFDLIFNPIVDTDYTGGFGNLEFVPASRVAYNVNRNWAVAAEEYSDFGQLQHFYSLHNQFHQVWAVVDRASKFVSVEAGVGVGVTAASDRLTLKLMLSRDLNRGRRK